MNKRYCCECKKCENMQDYYKNKWIWMQKCKFPQVLATNLFCILCSHFLNLPCATHLSCLQLIIQLWLFFLLFCSPLKTLSLVPFHSFSAPVACLPSLHLFTNIGGRKEGSTQTFGLLYPPHTRSASALQEAACSTHTHRLQSSAHSIRMARKLDWHLNNRINGAYGLSVNTLTK